MRTKTLNIGIAVVLLSASVLQGIQMCSGEFCIGSPPDELAFENPFCGTECTVQTAPLIDSMIPLDRTAAQASYHSSFISSTSLRAPLSHQNFLSAEAEARSTGPPLYILHSVYRI
ncbi:MAG: hypothetical protein AB1728_12395 [Bacteroidota bacterium]